MSGNLVLQVSTIPQGWSGSIVAPSFQQGVASEWSFAQYVPPLSSNFIIGTSGQTAVVNASKISELGLKGVTLDSANKKLVYDGSGASSTVTNVILEDVPSASADQDWYTRTSGPNVVWFQGMKTAAEVNAFRWVTSFGNDPLGNSSQAANCRWANIAGGCLELAHPASGVDQIVWWRPFAPLTAPGNGKSANDPAANGTLTVRSYTPTNGGTQIATMGNGFYSHSSFTGSAYDGSEFWLQLRAMRDPARFNPPNQNTTSGGKFTYLTICNNSNSSQEIVTYSGSRTFQMYHQPNATALSQEPGTDGTLQPGGVSPLWQWNVDGTWDTVMYHMVPGRPGFNECHLEVYGAHSGETSFTKFWDQIFTTQSYDIANGWQALIASIYNNGEVFPAAYTDRYREFIFQRGSTPIACPQV